MISSDFSSNQEYHYMIEYTNETRQVSNFNQF